MYVSARCMRARGHFLFLTPDIHVHVRVDVHVHLKIKGLPVVEDIVQFVVRGDGRVTGEAFVTFGSAADSEVR